MVAFTGAVGRGGGDPFIRRCHDQSPERGEGIHVWRISQQDGAHGHAQLRHAFDDEQPRGDSHLFDNQ